MNLGDAAQGAKMYSAVTGISMTHEQMIKAMNPIITLERCIHVREGRRRKHDMYSELVYSADSWKWTSKEEFSKIMDKYYAARGWDIRTGIPRRSTLETLGLKKIANELEEKYEIAVPS